MSDAGRSKIKVYVAHAMTGKKKRDLVLEACYTTRLLEEAGFIVLDPIAAESVPSNDEIQQQSAEQLAVYWKRDKEMIREADIVLDFMACNKSDGVAKEIGYARFCLWKPVVRVFPGMGVNISRIEDDVIVDTIEDAIDEMLIRFGTYEKLGNWRQEMWERCFIPWLNEQRKMNARYEGALNASYQGR